MVASGAAWVNVCQEKARWKFKIFSTAASDLARTFYPWKPQGLFKKAALIEKAEHVASL